MSQIKVDLDTKTLKALKGSLGSLSRLNVKVGVLSSQGGGEPVDFEDGITMAVLALIHEYGSPENGIPERSFLRAPFKDPTNLAQLEQLYVALVQWVLKQTHTSPAVLEQKLNLIGMWAVAQSRAWISTRKVSPQITNARTLKSKEVGGKQGNVALVDTGRLFQSITHGITKSET